MVTTFSDISEDERKVFLEAVEDGDVAQVAFGYQGLWGGGGSVLGLKFRVLVLMMWPGLPLEASN